MLSKIFLDWIFFFVVKNVAVRQLWTNSISLKFVTKAVILCHKRNCKIQTITYVHVSRKKWMCKWWSKIAICVTSFLDYPMTMVNINCTWMCPEWWAMMEARSGFELLSTFLLLGFLPTAGFAITSCKVIQENENAWNKKRHF